MPQNFFRVTPGVDIERLRFKRGLIRKLGYKFLSQAWSK